MKLSDQAAALLLSKTVTAGLVFILGPILVRFLTQAEYGTFLQVNLIATFVVTAAPIGFSQSFAYFIPRLGTGKHYQFVVRTLSLLTGFGIIGAVTIFLGRNYLGDWMNNANLAILAPYIGALIVATIISDTTETIFLSEKRGSLVAAILPIKAVARLAAILIPLLTGAGLKGVFLGLTTALFAEAVILYGYYVYQCRCHGPNAQVVKLKEQSTYCLPIGAALVVASVGGSVDMFVVSTLFDSAHYAIYARGAFDLPLVGIIPAMLFDLLAPRFVEQWFAGKKEEISGLLRESVRRVALIFYPIMCLSFVLA
ncbi:MAG: lipopolysaccharide biosynthesis protein, partial [Nitrospiraceae bacterium]